MVQPTAHIHHFRNKSLSCLCSYKDLNFIISEDTRSLFAKADKSLQEARMCLISYIYNVLNQFLTWHSSLMVLTQ